MKKEITFTGNFISIDDDVAKIDEFVKIFNESQLTEIYEDKVHAFSFEFCDRYLSIQFSDGSTFPRNPNVFNISTNSMEPNPRKKNQIEPKEYFAMIDFKTGFLWISNNNKRNLIKNLIQKEMINSEIVIKNIFNEQDFIECINRLDSIRLSAVPDIFIKTNSLADALSDQINQFDAVEAILHLKYQNHFVGNNLKDKLKSIFKEKISYKSIMISGRDTNNNGIIFNSNLFSKKIDFKVEVDDNQMYDSKEVFQFLKEKVENENY